MAMLLLAAISGAFLYYQQVYAFYDQVEFTPDAVQLTNNSTGEAEPIVVSSFDAIDAESSPLRYRACFETQLSQAMLTETFVIVEDAEPRVAPDWFDCFDAEAIGAALRAGEAVAFTGTRNLEYGIDRVVAVTADGRGFVWHQVNECGDKLYDGTPAGENCPERN